MSEIINYEHEIISQTSEIMSQKTQLISLNVDIYQRFEILLLMFKHEISQEIEIKISIRLRY